MYIKYKYIIYDIYVIHILYVCIYVCVYIYMLYYYIQNSTYILRVYNIYIYIYIYMDYVYCILLCMLYFAIWLYVGILLYYLIWYSQWYHPILIWFSRKTYIKVLLCVCNISEKPEVSFKHLIVSLFFFTFFSYIKK